MNLKFDNMQIDTKLAKEYLKSQKDFHSIVPSDYESKEPTQCWDHQDYKINYVTNFENIISKSLTSKEDASLGTIKDRHLKFQALASKIKENSNLIVQLEYLLRNKPINDSRLEIELLLKHLACTNYENFSCKIAMPTGASLLSFGYVTGINRIDRPVILASEDTAVICYLFTKLFHGVGLDMVYLVITTGDRIACCDLLDFNKSRANSGSIGVITEHSDIDSALDVFLTCSTKAPWKLRKILVQESVYQQFKDVLSWKCNLKGANDEITLIYRKLCPDAHKYDDRVFLLDYIGTTSTQRLLPEVTVEAYRTTKELLSLLGNYTPYYLSLWANDIAEANEVAYAVKSNVVWVNSFADFRGPSKISNAVFSTLALQIKKTERISKLVKLSENWLKLEIAERSKILWDAINNYKQSAGKGEHFLVKEKNALANGTNNGFVEVSKDYVCIGIDKPVGIKALNSMYESIFDLEILQAILLGNAFLIINKDEILDVFEKAGVPAINEEFERGKDCEIKYGPHYLTKVIWTNSGTIFAN